MQLHASPGLTRPFCHLGIQNAITPSGRSQVRQRRLRTSLDFRKRCIFPSFHRASDRVLPSEIVVAFPPPDLAPESRHMESSLLTDAQGTIAHKTEDELNTPEELRDKWGIEPGRLASLAGRPLQGHLSQTPPSHRLDRGVWDGVE
jgi:hypothetical protein